MLDITTRADIEKLVDDFYAKVTKDPMIGPIFIPIMSSGRWSHHVKRIYDFWHSSLLEEPVYKGDPFTPHRHMPLEKRHFDRWIELFHQTIDAHFEGPIAESAKAKSQQAALLFESKIRFLRKYE